MRTQFPGYSLFVSCRYWRCNQQPTSRNMKRLGTNRRESTKRTQTATMRRIVADFMKTAGDEYREAGYPFGNSLHGLLIWFEYGQHSTDN